MPSPMHRRCARLTPVWASRGRPSAQGPRSAASVSSPHSPLCRTAAGAARQKANARESSLGHTPNALSGPWRRGPFGMPGPSVVADAGIVSQARHGLRAFLPSGPCRFGIPHGIGLRSLSAERATAPEGRPCWECRRPTPPLGPPLTGDITPLAAAAHRAFRTPEKGVLARAIKTIRA